MAKIRIQCTECGHEARVPEQFRGKKVRCLRCHAKLRIPEDAPVEERSKSRSKSRTSATRPRGARSTGKRSRTALEARASRGGPSSKTRRKALSYLRDLLQDYDHAIESVPRGFEIDLRGEAFGLARDLVNDMLQCEAIRDVKLAGGTGECCITVSLQGWEFRPDESFADDDEDTEVFLRQGGADDGDGDWNPRGLVPSAVNLDDPHTDPGRYLREDAPRELPPESTMQSVWDGSSAQTALDPARAYERALQHMDEGEPAEAIKLLEKAVKADKRFARAVLALGKAYASTGDYQRARRAFRHLTKVEGEDAEAYVLHAAAAVRCDRLDEAKASLATAIQLDPEYTQAYRYAAQLYERLGESEKARKFRARYQALKLRG
jgi:tetratricopeptide (TPR) repeat protein